MVTLENFLNDIFPRPDVRHAIETLLMEIINKKPLGKKYIFYGEGASGKSMFSYFIEQLMTISSCICIHHPSDPNTGEDSSCKFYIPMERPADDPYLQQEKHNKNLIFTISNYYLGFLFPKDESSGGYPIVKTQSPEFSTIIYIPFETRFVKTPTLSHERLQNGYLERSINDIANEYLAKMSHIQKAIDKIETAYSSFRLLRGIKYCANYHSICKPGGSLYYVCEKNWNNLIDSTNNKTILIS